MLLEDKSLKSTRSTTFPLKLGYLLIDYSQKYIDNTIIYQPASSSFENTSSSPLLFGDVGYHLFIDFIVFLLIMMMR